MTRPTRTSSATGKPCSRGHRVIRWIETHCVFTDAEWIGKPFRLLRWQKLLILALFATDPDTGLRLYRWALIGVPKKNGKTELAAALALYFLLGDGEPSPLVVCAAASEEQADLVFGAATVMCQQSATLAQVTECFDKEILVPSMPGARLKRVAAAGGTNDGKNIHAVVCDELHEWTGPKGEKVWNVLTNGLGARRQPMVIQITTAGYDVEGTICGQQYTHCMRVAAGEVADPTYFVYWQSADPHATFGSQEYFASANPSYGVTVHWPFFADQLTKKTEAVVRRYFGNEWTLAEEIWEVARLWGALRVDDVELDPDLPTCVGIDVARKHDSTAVVAAQRQLVGDPDGGPARRRTVVHARIWENPYPPQHPRHSGWRLNIVEVEAYLRELHARFPAPTREIDGQLFVGPAYFYDERFFHRSAELLLGDGLCMVEYPQSDERMCPASQVLFELAATGELAHDGDSALARHVASVTAVDKPRGYRISKPKGSKRKIDGAVAAAIAAFEAQQEPPATPPTPAYYCLEDL